MVILHSFTHITMWTQKDMNACGCFGYEITLIESLRPMVVPRSELCLTKQFVPDTSSLLYVGQFQRSTNKYFTSV
jgi:hypothetical protein